MLYLLLRMISTKFIMRSMCLRADIMPTSRRRLNSRQCSDPVPPITSTNSCVSLKGDCSKPAWGEGKGCYHVKKSLLYCPLTQIFWRYAKNEAEVNVYYVAIRMKEYIAIVPKIKTINYIFYLQRGFSSSCSPVLNLQQIRYQTVSRTALYKVLLGTAEALPRGCAVFIDKIISQRFVRVLFDLMQ